MKTLYFLSGLPRSGSTLLGSILNQHPDVYVSPTSPLGDILSDIEKSFNKTDVQFTFDRKKISDNVYHAVLSSFYKHIDSPIILDKHRSWPENIHTVQQFILNKPKIVATYRPIPEILTSYISLINRTKHENNYIDLDLKNDNLPITNSNRADCLWREYVSPCYKSLVSSIANYPDLIHLVDYNQFVEHPQQEMDKICNFLEISSFDYNFLNIENKCSEEKDLEWGLIGLHDIRPKIKKISQNPVDVIGEDNVKLYSKFNI